MNTIEIPVEYEDIYDEVRKAYIDCWGMQGLDQEEAMRLYHEKFAHERNLNFRASRSVPPKIAKRIMAKAIIGYNGWEPDLMDHIPDDCEVTIAREGSVCVYVRGKLENQNLLHANEIDADLVDDETRIWWD